LFQAQRLFQPLYFQCRLLELLAKSFDWKDIAVNPCEAPSMVNLVFGTNNPELKNCGLPRIMSSLPPSHKWWRSLPLSKPA
jgi:hypothetical protein